MAKFIVNKGFVGEKEVEASSYRLDNGYWYFKDENDDDLITMIENFVKTIERA